MKFTITVNKHHGMVNPQKCKSTRNGDWASQKESPKRRYGMHKFKWLDIFKRLFLFAVTIKHLLE